MTKRFQKIIHLKGYTFDSPLNPVSIYLHPLTFWSSGKSTHDEKATYDNKSLILHKGHAIHLHNHEERLNSEDEVIVIEEETGYQQQLSTPSTFTQRKSVGQHEIVFEHV